MSVLTISFLVLFSILVIIYFTSSLKLNPFISLFLVSLFLAVTAIPNSDIVKILKEGFGSTMGSIGLLIIFGVIIAAVLDKTGGALSIANYMLSKTGTKHAPVALGITGFVAGLPIFCDSGFIILSGLAKSFSAKSKIAMPMIAIVLACSLYSVHCLVPIHPGALAAAGIMKVNLGYFILAGIIFAIPGAVIAYFWTYMMTKDRDYEHAHFIPEIIDSGQRKLPPVFLSLLPILLPLLLITITSVISLWGWKDQNIFVKFAQLVGQPVIALFVGVLFSLFLLVDKGIKNLNAIFETAIEKAGPILIIVASGGMFGMGRLFASLAMGAGSMMISHANDAYFWVITRFSDLQTEVTLKVYSTATVIMGITVFGCIWIISLFVL